MAGNYETKASSEWVSKLQDSITEIKISSANIDQKLDQMKEDFARVEVSIAKLLDTTAQQEVRLTLVEEKQMAIQQNIPKNLNEDMAIMKATIANYQKFLWVLASGVVGLLLKTLLDISI
jgi:chromosome segregation ATPase